MATTITGIEANLILFAFDDFFGVDTDGKVTRPRYSFTTEEELQKIRDKLFGAHEHPDEPEES